MKTFDCVCSAGRSAFLGLCTGDAKQIVDLRCGKSTNQANDRGVALVEVKAGRTVYLVGANGTGKSTLLYEWAKADAQKGLIAGNREVSFSSAAVSITAHQADLQSKSTFNYRQQPNARFGRNQQNNENWLNTLLFKLNALDHHNDRQFRKADKEGRTNDKAKLDRMMPIYLLNDAFSAASLPLSFEWDKTTSLLVNRLGVQQPYGFHEMSDGERAAFILTTSVILADDDATILIDEPERHLHRSISSPLLTYLRQIRPDLSWVISTHDLSLPRDDPGARLLITYAYDGSAWTTELIENTSDIPAMLTEAIYGARQKVLFIEGDASSRDMKLYQVLFDGVTLIPAGNCNDVRTAVKGLNGSSIVHHMTARGMVDADNRHDLARLAGEGVAALGVYAIESIYYHPLVIAALLPNAGTEVSMEEVLKKACDAVLEGDLRRLAKDAAYKAFQELYHSQCPSIEDFETLLGGFSIQCDNSEATINEIIDETCKAKAEVEWLTLIKRLKIKGTRAPSVIAQCLGYGGMVQYETAALKCMRKNEDLRAALTIVVPNPFLHAT